MPCFGHFCLEFSRFYAFTVNVNASYMRTNVVIMRSYSNYFSAMKVVNLNYKTWLIFVFLWKKNFSIQIALVVRSLQVCRKYMIATLCTNESHNFTNGKQCRAIHIWGQGVPRVIVDHNFFSILVVVQYVLFGEKLEDWRNKKQKQLSLFTWIFFALWRYY